jgi:histidinol-phosphate aminotransferase
MNWIEGFIRDEIKKLQPYEVPAVSCRVKLDAHENPYELPEFVREQITKRFSKISFNRYPDANAKELRKNLSLKLCVEPDMIMVGNGSDELILYLLLCFGKKKIIYPLPTFSMYEILALVAFSKPVGIPLQDNFEINDEAIIYEAGKEDAIIFLSYPNNPTGNCFDKSKIDRIIRETTSLIVLDEAYYEFSQDTFLPYVYDYERVVVLRTFSKAFGLAGLRVGYMIAQPHVIQQVKKVKLPYNLNVFSQMVAAIAIENAALFLPIVQQIKKEQERIMEKLNGIDKIKVYPSKANFILFKILSNISAVEVFKALLQEGVLIRCLDNIPGVENCLRVTIGKPEENDEFLQAICKVMLEN